MSSNDINKAQQEADKLNRQQFDLTLNGQAENAGIREVSSAADGNANDTLDSKEKKQKMSWEMLQLITDFENDIGDMPDNLKDLRDEMNRVGNRINKDRAALEGGNMDAITFQLMSEHDYSQGKIDGMNDWQKTEALRGHLESDVLTFGQLKEQYIKEEQALQQKLNSDEFHALPQEAQERMKELYKAESQARIVEIDARADHLDRERAMTEVRVENDGNSSLFSGVDDTKKADEYSMATEPGGFDDFAAFDEFSSVSSSFADTLDEDNQFSPSAGSITQSFNQAGGLEGKAPDNTVTEELERVQDATYNGQSFNKGMNF